jgi:CotH protein
MGFSVRKKLVLTSTFDDNAYVRQRLAFELWSSMDPEHLQIHSGSAVLYLDGEYHGLYTVTDHVDRHLMGQNGLATTGSLYKAVKADARFVIREPLEAGLEKKEGLPETDFSDIWALITFVDGTSDADFDANVSDWLDVRDYGDWWVFATITRIDDSVAKNSYHYIEQPGAPARFAPWDFNASFGQTFRTRRIPADQVVSYRTSNRIFERLRANPARWAELRRRRLEVMQDVFHPDHVDALIDGYVAEIEASALRDWAKWETAYRAYPGWRARQDVTSYEEEVAYVRSWYREHWTAIKDAETGTLPVESEPADLAPDPSEPPSSSDTPPL